MDKICRLGEPDSDEQQLFPLEGDCYDELVVTALGEAAARTR
jgi:hypothetical protein